MFLTEIKIRKIIKKILLKEFGDWGDVDLTDDPVTPNKPTGLNKLLNEEKYKEAWSYIDSLKLDVPKGEGTELISGFNGVTMRIHKPRREKRYD